MNLADQFAKQFPTRSDEDIHRTVERLHKKHSIKTAGAIFLGVLAIGGGAEAGVATSDAYNTYRMDNPDGNVSSFVVSGTENTAKKILKTFDQKPEVKSTYTVKQGDTEETIARKVVGEGGNVQAYEYKMDQLNPQLVEDQRIIQPGEELKLPK